MLKALPHLILLFAAAQGLGKEGAADPVFNTFASCEKVKPPQPQAKTNDAFFTFNLLVWDAREEGLEFAYRNIQSQTNQELSSLEPKSKFEPAFRIGAGGFLPYDRWTLGALYTFYHTDRKCSQTLDFDSSAAPGPGMIAVWTYPSAFSNQNTAARFSSAKNHWKLNSSFFDLSLSRESEISSLFFLSPTFGVRTAWLHQYYTVDYNSGNIIDFGIADQIHVSSSEINMVCNSNNVGLFFGCDAQWRIGQHFDFFSDLSFACLASRFHTERRETDLFTNLAGILQTQSIDLKNRYWSFRPQGQIELGVRFFDSFFCSSRQMRYHISASYETQLWWKQNLLLRYLDKLNNTSAGAYVAPTQGNLMFHGLDLEAGLDF